MALAVMSHHYEALGVPRSPARRMDRIPVLRRNGNVELIDRARFFHSDRALQRWDRGESATLRECPYPLSCPNFGDCQLVHIEETPLGRNGGLSRRQRRRHRSELQRANSGTTHSSGLSRSQTESITSLLPPSPRELGEQDTALRNTTTATVVTVRQERQYASVLKRDGSVDRVDITQLFPNHALERWRADPTLTLRECRDENCRGASACRLAHLMMDVRGASAEPSEPVASVEAVEVAPTQPPAAAVEEVVEAEEEVSHQEDNSTIIDAAPHDAVPFHHRNFFHHTPPPPIARVAPPSADSARLRLQPAFAFPDHFAHIARQFALLGSRNHSQRASTNPARTCNLCYEEYSNQKTLYTCDQKHNTCSRCLAQYILTNWRDNRRASSGELRCCHAGCTSRPLTTQEVVRLVTSKAALEVYIDHTNRQTAAQCYAEAHAIVLQESTQAAADVLLQKQLQKSMHAARMCPHCQFGPIDFFGCDDLAQHHGEERNGARTRNSCPQCGYFSAAIQSWQRWDGVTRDFGSPATGNEGGAGVDAGTHIPDDDVEHVVVAGDDAAVGVADADEDDNDDDTSSVASTIDTNDAANDSTTQPAAIRHDDGAIPLSREEMMERAVAIVLSVLPEVDREVVEHECGRAMNVTFGGGVIDAPEEVAELAIDALLRESE
ncbi:Hypothetical protein, putative [Bodo saltans]|uniref:RING-type domain-containing protein n=1 Tax=Bodo saltans TaxID=75058 RepID=A0A0S4JMZ4_BODSA|nr:Hypothetical protein, putative [Bodo saltans]|eukprot:CUG90483.1 Hypothetical protein, putative [Bodo saltans]